MRLRRSLAPGITGITAAAAALASAVTGTGPAVAAQGLPGSEAVAVTVAAVQRPQAAQPPVCSDPTGEDFPIGTRIRGGPPTYEAGGGYRSWSVELANTTRGTCGNIHPVVVIVDKERQLRPRQVQLEFHDGKRWRTVGFERTDRDENVGVFDDGFPGFTVKAGKTRTVKVRLSFTSAARSEQAVISAAVVQRRDDDGDWVGESEDYPFGIEGDGDTGGTGDTGGVGDTGGGVGAEEEPEGSVDAGRDGGADDGGRERSEGGDPSYADELAATGPRALLGVTAIACALFAAGWALLTTTRRVRAARRR
ncbi:hypothetical protein [Streptomyces longisporoflavus]|uniref:Uncharacterized protein n=1 Tax=Streptomyces longisporoflavus TaxID=28044 RepID=A0ABW7QJ92_9ACTN